jgi:hypothetical protein
VRGWGARQLNHAAPGWIFQLYCWSFVLVCGFLLLNIFLAILVDAYIEVRAGTGPVFNGAGWLMYMAELVNPNYLYGDADGRLH